ncbi:uncharacterized protein MYCGRDRAFT_51425 [Zymoseptoria tritici IPO323]|uniref:Protein kinase domain-containing protein n=1 Tax=Zymoseptoria tritici (strain CBS 115943 / IPO323) TaxID=336722 RepID=F9XPW4_ZYMTI|nr:uncharacterized protein MYCGRDRAFT_51425 [Zymoseptoria tritici IPO323]EGP82538.1 hypothetical protein MYCGRDRAFT_51425 [Zymoseptoria tritici IPO323]
MPAALKIGQILKGKVGCYSICKQLGASVWLASDCNHERNVILKYADHWRIRSERDVLLRFQEQTPRVRPLLDEVEGDEQNDLKLILKHLDEDLLHTLGHRELTRAEVKHIGKGVLEALRVLHEDGFVHTDVKPSNILLNFDETDSQRITDVQLADLEATVSQDSEYAKDGETAGTAIFRSPEMSLGVPWTTSTDIWSLGATLISLIYGGGFHIFSPGVSIEDDQYDIEILRRHHQFFGPFPHSYNEIADERRLSALIWLMDSTPTETLMPFSRITNREISEEDKEFILRIMKLDYRDRPTARQLLDDEWFIPS